MTWSYMVHMFHWEILIVDDVGSKIFLSFKKRWFVYTSSE